MSEKRLIDRLVEASATVHVVPLMGVDLHVSQITIAEQSKIAAMYPEDGDSAKRQASILILKCRDAEGKPVFTGDDREALATKVGARLFADVWAAINGASLDDQAEK